MNVINYFYGGTESTTVKYIVFAIFLSKYPADNFKKNIC